VRIAIVGAGGVGGYYAALLTKAGHDVVLYARGEHLQAIRNNGLTIKDHDSAFTVRVTATDSPSALIGAEWAMVAVKSYSLVDVGPVLSTLAANGTAIVPLLNGVTVVENLKALGVDERQILGGATVMNAHKISPGVIEHLSKQERFVVGEMNGDASDRTASIATAMRSIGIESVATREIVLELWQKFNMLCAISAACGMARSDLGHIRESELGQLLLERAVGEIASIARALDVAIPPTQERDTLARIASMSASVRPSFAVDVERGGPTELDVLSGAVSRFGRQTGISTPVHDTAAAVLAR
jgi:2-dehydropantoate 2-reductase